MSVRRWILITLAWVLVVTLSEVTGPVLAAAAGGPSVPLPSVPSVPVQQQNMGPLPADQAGSNALSGDQPAGAPATAGADTPTATSLSPSATWQVSAQTGDFSWSYPLRVPPAPGGLEPDLALSYRSSAVDGRTSTTNNQPSWVGDGWDLNPGFVERTYVGCPDDKEGSNPGQKVGDLCWRSDNATASYNGGGGMLICCDAGGKWRPKNDDGSKVERFIDGNNGDDNGEHWKITTVNGTQYFYGSRPASKSTWTVPVFGDDTGEPCHKSTFDASSCPQAWRWNLDKVVDRHGNMMIYDYDVETNSYGFNFKDAAVSYMRGGTLKQIEYGLHTRHAVPATGRVVFDTADRCIPGSTCTVDKKENWPDTALKERCVVATCKDHYSPTFWSTQRLASITTQVRRGSAYDDVDRWTLEQAFPDPGDGEKAALWLKSITHTGLVGDAAITLPAVTFAGHQMPNRVHRVDGLSPLIRYRITGIVSESGGVVSVNYAPPDCPTPHTSPETNTKRCFPVRWARPDHAERTDYFHKYVVESVVESDRISANPQQVTSYEYLGGAAWHYDTSEFTPNDKKTWNDYRGFAKVRIREGAPNDPGGPVTMTEQRFFRGMHGDRANSAGGTKLVQIEDSELVKHDDHDWLQGFGLETIRYLGDTATVVDKTITTPVWQGPTATRGDYKAYILGPGMVRTFTTLDGGRARRETKTVTEYDDRGQVTKVDDQGDVGTVADDRCTRTTYVRNLDNWLLSLPSRIETVAVNCAVPPLFPRHAISDLRTSFDGQAPGAAPITGSVSRVEQLAERPASGPVYKTVGTARHDDHGRVIESADGLGRPTKAAFTPAVGGPTTQTVATNALQHSATTTLEPAHGQPLTVTDPNGRMTESAYDALGRLTQAWLPNRPRSVYRSGNSQFSYLVNRDAPTAVVSTQIGPNGNYTSSTTLYDGQLRPRQVQTPAAGGGRLLTDTRYDSHGRVFKSTQPYFNDAPVDTTLWVASDVEVAGLTTTEYDGASRPVAQVFRGGATRLWQTTMGYGGDRVYTTPPEGGMAATVITDARGQTTELRQHRTPTPTGDDYDRTRYTYTPAGQLSTLTDPAGNPWEYRYDLRGRQVWSKDPDKGISTSRYDDAGQLISRTDSRQQTIAYAYDDLGRKTADHLGSISGPKLAAWTYDILVSGVVAKGNKATATSFDANGNAYTSSVLAYTALYQPQVTSITIPESEGLLAKTYQSVTKYNFDGSLASETYPEIGGLFAETVSHTYDDDGRPLRTYGGETGTTVEYVAQTDYTRYGETQRTHLGEGTKRAWLSRYYDDHTRRINRTIVDAEVPRPMQTDTHFSYDPAGNLTSIADTPQERPADVQCFRYDHLRRLTEAWTPGNGCAAEPSTAALGGPAAYWQSFGYDAVGNRLRDTRHATGGDTVRTYTYPAPGQVRPHAVSTVSTTGPAASGTESYGYDDAGNTVTRGGQRLDWDAAGRLAKVTQAGQVTESVYDADGKRLIRRDPVATTLNLGGQELRLERATGRFSATRYYSHGGEAIAVRTPAGLSWLASDHQNTQQIAIDAAAQSVTQRRQLPFGGPRGPGSSFPGEKGFVGGTIDASTGLTQVGARAYDPAAGRFLSVDPVLNAADPQQLHGYAYANNSPVTFSDPTGLFCDSCDFYSNPANVPDPDPGEGPGSNDIHPKDYTTKHNAVQRKAAERIRRQAAALGMRKPRLEEGVRIPGASKKCADSGWNPIPGCYRDGFADIVLTVEICPKDGGCYDQKYVWEVKSYGQVARYGYDLPYHEAEWYARALQKTSGPDEPVFARRGWDIGGPYKLGDARFPKTEYWGGLDGSVIYGDTDKEKVRNHVGRLKEIGMLSEFKADSDKYKHWRVDSSSPKNEPANPPAKADPPPVEAPPPWVPIGLPGIRVPIRVR